MGGATSGAGTVAGGGAGASSGGNAGAASGSAGAATSGSAGAPGSGGAGGLGGGDGGAGGFGGAQAGGGSGSTVLSFQADIWPVYVRLRDPPFVYPGAGSFSSCVDSGLCHSGPTPDAGLEMPDAETAYGMLIDVPSVSRLCAETIRVVPGNPVESCLILFYEGRLRNELDWVDTAEIDLMRTWIMQGALP
jgi:hypothetical protein